MALLEVRGLHAGYGKLDILHGIDVALEAGNVVRDRRRQRRR